MANTTDFEIYDGELSKYKRKGGDVIIPDGVTEIFSGAFLGCKSLTSITIPNGVTSIGIGTFSGCTTLAEITIPNSVTEIPHETFSDTALMKIVLPNSITKIAAAFKDCKAMTEILIPDSVTEIGFAAFDGCNSLKRIQALSVNKLGYTCELYDIDDDKIEEDYYFTNEIIPVICPKLAFEEMRTDDMKYKCTLGYLSAPALYSEK